MALRFSPTGSAVYGTGTIAIDGTTPAALTGTVGPAAWKSTGVLVYQDGGTGAGPWTLKQLTLPATIAAIDASPASLIAGGGGEWAAWEPVTGLRTSIAIGPFANALLGDVSEAGELLKIDNTASRSGLTAYDATGAQLYANPSVVLQSTQVCLRDSILSYYDVTGWHLVDLNTGEPPDWFPRVDGVTALVPLTYRGNLYVLEKSGSGLTLRLANKSIGWVLSADPNIFPIDGVPLSGTQVLCGTCNTPAETPSSLVTFKCTITNAANISVQTGTIVAGAIVYGSAQSVGTTPFVVGPQEGNSLLPPNPSLPFTQPLVHQVEHKGLMMTPPWEKALRLIGTNQGVTADVVQHLPTPNLTANGYDKIASSGQPTMMAQQGLTTLTLESPNVGDIVLDPSTNTASLNIQGSCYISMTTGSIPPDILFIGADVMLTKVPVS